VKTITGVILSVGFASLAQASLVVDRGLPDSNLNNAAGSDRSNVAWAFNGDYLAGDDFTLGAPDPGKRYWRIDRVSVWQIGGDTTLGDKFDSVSLFLGPEGGGSIRKVSSANLSGNTTNNPNVAVSQVTYPGTNETYQGSSGSLLNMWQIDFANLGLFGAGTHLFAMGGVGSGDLLTFNHASNAALSGTPQEGADDRYRWFSGTGAGPSIAPGGFIDSNGSGWDKSSDINIRVYAQQVPEPFTLALFCAGLLAMGAIARRQRGLSPAA
jgi:hypothetical protein